MEEFNWLMYKNLNPDLEKAGLKTKEQYYSHWVKYGQQESRPYIISLNEVENYSDFDWKNYASLNPDLKEQGLITKEQYIYHYLNYGIFEDRIYKPLEKLPEDFNYLEYLFLNPNLPFNSKKELESHYTKYGKTEGRNYKLPSQSIMYFKKNSVKMITSYQKKNYAFHVLIPTSGNNSLFKLLDDLEKQLTSNDYISIIYEGIENIINIEKVKNIMKKWNIHSQIYIECSPIQNSFSIRNIYKKLSGDYIIHLNEDDRLEFNGFLQIRNDCLENNTMYIYDSKNKVHVIPNKINQYYFWNGSENNETINMNISNIKYKVEVIQKKILNTQSLFYKNIDCMYYIYMNNNDSKAFLDNCNEFDILKEKICMFYNDNDSELTSLITKLSIVKDAQKKNYNCILILYSDFRFHFKNILDPKFMNSSIYIDNKTELQNYYDSIVKQLQITLINAK